MKTAKNLLKKSKVAGTDFHLAELAWRNTPSEGLENSPAQRMFGCCTRTMIPTTRELLKPKIVEDVQGKLLKRKQLQAKHYNISAKELHPPPPPVSKGEIVRVKPTDRSGRWFKARVAQQVDLRSYEVRTEDGKIFRRNRRHLRSSKEPACVRVNPEPIHMPSQTHLPESLPIPKPSVSPLKTSAPWRYHRLRNLEKWLDPRNLRAAPRLVKCHSSPPPPPNQLTVQLPGVAVCPTKLP